MCTTVLAQECWYASSYASSNHVPLSARGEERELAALVAMQVTIYSSPRFDGQLEGEQYSEERYVRRHPSALRDPPRTLTPTDLYRTGIYLCDACEEHVCRK